jgi:STE24 endopeptidase
VGPTAIFAVFAAVFAADVLWGLFLTRLNYRSATASEAAVPPEFAGIVTEAEHRKACSYSKARMRLGAWSSLAGSALSLAAVATGFLGAIDSGLEGIVRGEYLRGLVFLALVALLSELVSMPFSLYSTFGLEKRFGFNTTSLGTWLADLLKGSALGAAIGGPLILLLFYFIDAAGRLWWLWAAAGFALFSVAVSIAFPVFIAPLFNKFKALEEGPLAARIRDLAERTSFRVGGIFVMDGSKRSKHSNAYFAGFGRARRIVLFDTLVAQMSEDEVLAVLAHEIGHWKKRHVLKASAVSIAFSFLAFFVLSLLKDWSSLYAAFGFHSGSKEALFLILGIASGPFTFFLNPVFSAWSRRREYEADRFAVESVGPEAMSGALLRLSRENASNLAPHPLYSAWYYSHPAPRERLAAIGAGRGSDSGSKWGSR